MVYCDLIICTCDWRWPFLCVSEFSKKRLLLMRDISTHDWCSASVRMLNDVTTILTTELNREIGTEIYCLYHLFAVYFRNENGPWLAHLSDIITADMQMLCNIFPILSSQPMKRSSFEQFLVLKKNIWAWQSMEHHLNKLSITFQQ